ncbi:ribosomal-processing cysteine protease Prp [Heliophilum fasciatum]|uniref:Ribosomal processing cysteine protease Prp n=1 Tax=Heliophilum fasciatum TaxID=35700 RepID=A0A4R2S778_9FIRM|nr:ribosomal-processing cysteine protease Prp [Heliophilum fasciatum]MCW2277122.1 uncharacterized protein YsxB (DUF464 family) [Heliophilum fasciatum]TCP68241.1 hypothetical protein EDD73_104144 [Heliophilum fasciatum]
MVKVEIFHDDQGRILAFNATGHAGAAPAGQDIVCAGVSAITFTAVNGLEHFLGADAIEVEAGKPGNLALRLRDSLSPEAAGTAQIILETMMIGLEHTQQNYPRYLLVRKRRCLPC